MIVRVFRAERVVLEEGVRPASIWVDAAGHIADIRPHGEQVPAGVACVELSGGLVLPGLVDPHVHINEPGRTEWEGFATATRAAAAGGVTALVDMPLNSSPVTTTRAAFADKRAAATAAPLAVDVGFHAGVVPGNAPELEPLAEDGVLAAKAFLVHSGIDDFPNVTAQDLDEAMPLLTRLGLPLLVHSELDEARGPLAGDPRAYATWLASRPAAMEDAAIGMLLERAERHGTRLHIVHLASASAVAPLREARQRGLPVTVETCPQYLTLAAEDIADGATAFKCAPPIRERAVQDALWQALAEGVIDLVASDHSPAPPSLKHLDDGDFLAAWGGIASLGLGLSLVWDAAHTRGLAEPTRIADWLCGAPARLCGLDGRKGRIAIGYDADLVVFDPEQRWTVSPDDLHYRHRISPYLGRTLTGRVTQTWLRGERAFSLDEGFSPPRGELLLGRREPNAR